MKRFNKEQGFTLIEVLVASAIAIASIGVLMQLFSSGLNRMHHAGEYAHLLVSERLILEALAQVNPASKAGGEGIAEGFHYRWRTHIESAWLPIYEPMGVLHRQAAIYDVHVTIIRPEHPDADLTFKRLGWK